MTHYGKFVHKTKSAAHNKKHQVLNTAIYFIAFIGPLATLPQIYTIWVKQTAQGVSLITWISYFVISVVWFYYGYVHKEKAIMFSNFLSMIVQLGVVISVSLQK